MILISIPGVEAASIADFVVAKKKSKKKKNRAWKWLFGHFRKIAILIANFFFNHNFVFKAVGWVNKKLDAIVTVFIAYPASEKYALAYVYPRHRWKMEWLPWPVGIFRQDGKWGIMFVISSVEEDFVDSKNNENLKILVDRTDAIRKMLGAKQMTFAGILPGVLLGKRLIKKSPEAEITVEAVIKAEDDLRHFLYYPDNTPLIIIGGSGFIGKRIVYRLKKDREVYSIDIEKTGKTVGDWPGHLRGQKAILVNITKKGALNQYINKFWKELVLLNETYPEPSEVELKRLANIGSKAYHIAGVKSNSFPNLPRAYAGGIPCCAAWLNPSLEIIIREMIHYK